MKLSQAFYLIIFPILLIALQAGYWRLFRKMGEPGWKSLVPILHTVVLLNKTGRSGIWFLLFLVPMIDVFFAYIVLTDLAARFGKGRIFSMCMMLLPFVFIPLLGFGPAEYTSLEEAEGYAESDE